jgi:hypothetical protein
MGCLRFRNRSGRRDDNHPEGVRGEAPDKGRTSGAKALVIAGFYGTAEAVPFV